MQLLEFLGFLIKNIKRNFQMKFDSVELERQFLDYEALHRIFSVRAAIITLILLIMSFSRFDFEYGRVNWYITFLIRLLGPITVLTLWLATTYSPQYYKNTRLYDFCFATISMILTVFLSFAIGYLFEIPFVDWSFPFLANTMLIVFYTGLLLIISSLYFVLFLFLISVVFESCLLQLTSHEATIKEINQNFAAGILMAFIANRGLEKLRRAVFQRNDIITAERERANTLLYDLVPESVAQRLKAGEVVADEHKNLVVIFIDIVSFTQFSAHNCTEVMLGTLKAVFNAIDNCASKYSIEKVKTMGDGYMAVSHQMASSGDEFKNVYTAANFCLEVIEKTNAIFNQMSSPLSLRIGLHVGDAFGGVLGANRPFYDYWGNTINIANQLEEYSEPNRIAVSTIVKQLLAEQFTFIDRRQVFFKGIGLTEIWFLDHSIQPDK